MRNWAIWKTRRIQEARQVNKLRLSFDLVCMVLTCALGATVLFNAFTYWWIGTIIGVVVGVAQVLLGRSLVADKNMHANRADGP